MTLSKWLRATDVEEVGARHPGARFTVERSGSATAVHVAARDEGRP